MYVTRLNQKKIYQAFENSFITLLIGPRRVGKSSLVQEYFREFPKERAILLNLDLLEIQLAIEAGNLHKVLEYQLGSSLEKLGQKIWLVIDEAQKSPRLFDQIKILYDRFKDTGLFKCILTGSGSLSLSKYSSESLAGRIFSYSLSPFGLEEGFQLRHGPTSLPRPFSQLLLTGDLGPLQDSMLSLQPHSEQLQQCLQDQLVWGGFPEVLKLDDPEERKIYLANYRQTYLEKDIRSLEQVGDLKSFNQLLELLAFQVGSLRQDKRLYDILGISAQTLRKYLNILEATGLYIELPPYIHTPFKRIVKSGKAYLLDNGLLSYLRSIFTLGILEGSDAVGAWFENWVVGTVQTLLETLPIRPRVYYWKTSGNVEVDLILDLGPCVLPIEIKYTQKPDSKKVKHLKQFLHEEKRAPFGIIIYNGPYQYQERDRIVYFPAWALL